MSLLDRFKKVKTFVFDVDGVLTDGNILLMENGQFLRNMNTKDGFALQLAVKKGYRIVVISGGASDAVTLRLNKLGIKDVFLKVENKKKVLHDYVQQHGLQWEEMLFMGDDVPDYECMTEVGIACAPADAVGDIRQVSHYISALPGGRGCVRDVIEKVLKLNDHWDLHTSIASK
ncbi:MAG: HAD-IIIA family hydrolase [Chitinophagaceae bacterium]